MFYKGPYSKSALGPTRNGFSELSPSIDVSYQFRIICVVGTSCWSLMAFIVSAQVMKPLYVLLLFVVPYTLVAFIWWYVYSAQVIWSAAGLSCSDYSQIQNAMTLSA